MRIVLALLIFLLDVWALAGVTALPARRQRLKWILFIVGVPIVGALLWARRKRGEVAAA